MSLKFVQVIVERALRAIFILAGYGNVPYSTIRKMNLGIYKTPLRGNRLP